MQGLRYLFAGKDILSLIWFMAFINFVAAVYESLLTPMVLSRNGGGEWEPGIVSGMAGIAGLLGSLLVTKIKAKRKIPLIVNIMGYSTLLCNTLLAVGRSYIVWAAGIFLGNLLIPVLMANVSALMRSRIPLELQGRVFSARNTLQYTSIPLGYLFGGACAEMFFEPFMTADGKAQALLAGLIGNGPGIALLYLCCGAGCLIGCKRFLHWKTLRSLDDE